jgi:hypothetical protein
VEDVLQLANIAGGPVGRVVSVERKSDHRSAAFLRQDGLYTIILRGLASVAERSPVFLERVKSHLAHGRDCGRDGMVLNSPVNYSELRSGIKNK